MNFQEKIVALKNEVYSIDIVALGYKVTNVCILLMMLLCAFMLFSDICFATDIFQAGKEIGKEIYKSIVGISSVMAGVGITFAACMYFFSPNERNVAAARGWIVRIILAWVVINGAGLLLVTIKGLTGRYTNQNLDI